MGGFISWTDGVERIILRQFGNRLLWILVPVSLLAVLIFNQAQRAQMRWPTENLLAMLNFTLEITLALAFLAIIAWERRAASRAAAPCNDLPGADGYACKFYIAAALALLVVTGLFLGELAYFQYVHLHTVLQRGFLVWMTCAMLPGIYLLINTRGEGGMRSVGAALASLIILAVLELIIVSIARFVPAMERLGDIYYWNMLYTGLAQERIWLVIYNPWLSLYLLGYAGVNIALFLCVMMRVRALRKRGVDA